MTFGVSPFAFPLPSLNSHSSSTNSKKKEHQNYPTTTTTTTQLLSFSPVLRNVQTMSDKRDEARNNKRKRNVGGSEERERDGVVCLCLEQGLCKRGGGMFSFIFSTQLVGSQRGTGETETVRGARDSEIEDKKWKREQTGDQNVLWHTSHFSFLSVFLSTSSSPYIHLYLS